MARAWFWDTIFRKNSHLGEEKLSLALGFFLIYGMYGKKYIKYLLEQKLSMLTNILVAGQHIAMYILG